MQRLLPARNKQDRPNGRPVNKGQNQGVSRLTYHFDVPYLTFDLRVVVGHRGSQGRSIHRLTSLSQNVLYRSGVRIILTRLTINDGALPMSSMQHRPQPVA
jgi:hypothetical protein